MYLVKNAARHLLVGFNRVMEIRACTGHDLAKLTARWKVPGNVHEGHHSNQLTGHTTYLVAWTNDEPLAAGVLQWEGCIGPNARAAFPTAVEINHLQVRDEYRGRGIGTAVLAFAEQLIGSAGKAQVALAVADDNPQAESLYLRLGYRPTGIFNVSEYSWVSAEGLVQHAIERDQLLIKDLASVID